jgi:hypothetical protein
MALSYREFLKSLPQSVLANLPEHLQGIQVRQPWRWLIQFHYGEARLHYEVSRPAGRRDLELGFHCEARAVRDQGRVRGERRGRNVG